MINKISLPKIFLLSFDTPKQVKANRSGTYQDIFVANNSSEYNEPHYLVIIYPHNIGKDFKSFIEERKNSHIPLKIYFHISQLTLIENTLGVQLKSLPPISYLEGSWKEDIANNAEPQLNPSDVKNPIIYSIEDKLLMKSNNADFKNIVDQKWNRFFITSEHQLRYPYRDMMTHSCLLETNETGVRLSTLDLQELRHRVVATENLFASWRSDLEWDGIFSTDHPGIISDVFFDLVQEKVNEAYNPYKELALGVTTHKFINMLFSRNKSDRMHLLEIISNAIQENIGLLPESLEHEVLVLRSDKYKWVSWIELHTSPKQITNTKLLVKAYATLLYAFNRKVDSNDSNYSYYSYILLGPSFGVSLCSEAREFKNIYVLWALSVVAFIKGLTKLKQQYTTDQLQECFPSFLKEQEDQRAGVINYTHSTTIGFRNYQECLSE